LLQLCTDILFHKDGTVYRLTIGTMKDDVIMAKPYHHLKFNTQEFSIKVNSSNEKKEYDNR